MTSVLSHDLAHGITLSASGAYTAPFTITQTGALMGAAYSNMSGPAAPFLENMGFVESVVFTNGGTIQNAGTISNAGLGYGIVMRNGNGTISNAKNADIYGGNYGIAILNGEGLITNAGSIGGLAGAGVQIATGTVTNLAGAAIYAHEIALKIQGAGQISNAGDIAGNQYAVFMNGGDVTNSGTMSGQLGSLFDFSADITLTNSGTLEQENSPFGTGVKIFGGTVDNTGFIYGATGLYLANAGTVINAGTIAAERDAILFGGDQASRLIIDPGAVFIGNVTANQAAGNTLELASGKSTLSGIGEQFTGFQTIAFDSGATWDVKGDVSGFDGDIITGFSTADELDIAGLGLAGTSYLTLSSADVLSVSSGLSLTFSAANAGEYFAIAADGHGGDTIEAFTGTPPFNGKAVTLSASETKITKSIDTLGLIGTYTMKTAGGYTNTAIGAAVLDTGTPKSVTNSATIESDSTSAFNAGIVLTGASTFINAGTIIAASGIEGLSGGDGTFIENTKDINATIGAGIYIQQYGTALNKGTISADGDGIQLGHGGYVHNTGTIAAKTGIAAGGAYTYAYNAGAITTTQDGISLSATGVGSNAGDIRAGGDGIDLMAGGIAYNYGFISAATGIAIVGGGTIDEFGTLIGSQFAASFANGAPNLFVIDSASKITGDVSGGAGELELTGTPAGTVSLSQFEDFGTIDVAAKSKWDLAGTFVTSAALVNNGDLTLAKTSKGTFEGAVSGTGTINLAKNPLTFAGAVAATQKIDFAGTGETLTLADPTQFAATIGSFKTGDTIDITGISLSDVTGTAFAKNVLTISEAGENFHLAFTSAASLGSDVFLLTKEGNGFAITVSKPGAMTLLKPAAQAAASFPDLPTLLPTPSPLTPTYITPAAAPGIISNLLTPASAPAFPITLQS